MEYNAFDLSILEALHIKMAWPWLQTLMVIISSEIFFIITSSLLLVYVAQKFTKKSWLPILGLLAAVGLTDSISAHILKPLFGRLRPCQVFEEVQALAGCAGLFSFPSNHASNTMAVAIFIYFAVSPRVGHLLIYLALLVGASRVVLGVHYPTDILFGYTVGGGIGFLSARLTGKIWDKIWPDN